MTRLEKAFISTSGTEILKSCWNMMIKTEACLKLTGNGDELEESGGEQRAGEDLQAQFLNKNESKIFVKSFLTKIEAKITDSNFLIPTLNSLCAL